MAKNKSNNDNLLVIVDMQDGFKAGTDTELIRRINREQKKRKLSGAWEVVYLCYDSSGDLTVNHIEGSAKIWKEKDDGSYSIMSFIAGWGKYPKVVEFWGINLFCCVLATATGFVSKLQAGGRADEVTVRINMDYCFDFSDCKDLEIVGTHRRREKL